MTLVRFSASPFQACLRAALLAVTLGGCGGEPFGAMTAVPSGLDDPGDDGELGQTEPASGATNGAVPAGTGAGTAGDGNANGDGSGSGGGGGSGNGDGDGTIGDPNEIAGGNGGEASTGSAGVAPSLDVIDDVEGDFPRLPQRAGRNGGWYVVHDGSGGHATSANAVMLQPARGESRFAVGVDGAGFTAWGVQLGVALTSPAAGYDASRYDGLRFLAKGTGTWTLLITDRLSVPQGGVCVEGSGDPVTGCYRFVGASFAVGSDWKEYNIRFDDLLLLQAPTSDRKLDAASIYDILFNFQSAHGDAFELLVDDLAFIEKPAAD